MPDLLLLFYHGSDPWDVQSTDWDQADFISFRHSDLLDLRRYFLPSSQQLCLCI